MTKSAEDIYLDNNIELPFTMDDLIDCVKRKEFDNEGFWQSIIELESMNLHELDEDTQNELKTIFWEFITYHYYNVEKLSQYYDDFLIVTICSAIRNYVASFFTVEELLDKLEPLLQIDKPYEPSLLCEVCKMMFRKLYANPYYNGKNKTKIEHNLINIYKQSIEINLLKKPKDGAIAINAILTSILLQSDYTFDYLSNYIFLNKEHWFIQGLKIRLEDVKKIWKFEDKNPCPEVLLFVDKILEIVC